MIKVEELRDSSSCMNRAKPMEMTFVLLARDITAPWVVRLWCILRVLLLKNKPRDAQVREAWRAASIMAEQRRQKVHKPLFNVEHRGFVAEAFPSVNGLASVVVTKDGKPYREFEYPAYRVWNIATHWVDMVEGELEGGNEMRA